VPKWGFHARRAELKMGDRITLHNSVFHIKALPAFVLPFALDPGDAQGTQVGVPLAGDRHLDAEGPHVEAGLLSNPRRLCRHPFRTDIYTARGLDWRRVSRPDR